MTKQEEQEQVEYWVKKLSEPTIDNAIEDMKMAKALFITKKGKVQSSIVNEYIKDKKKFLPSIIEGKRDEFISEYTRIFEDVGVEDDTLVASRLLNLEHTGDVMMLLNANTDWNLVKELLHSQGHSGATIDCLTSKILYFSPYGLDFIEHIWSREQRENVEKEIDSKKLSVSN